MATLTVQQPTTAGITPSYASAAEAGDEFANDGLTLLQVKGTGTQKVVTITAQRTSEKGATLSDITVTIPATTGDKMIGPFDPSIFNDSAGKVQVTYSDEADLTVAAFKIVRY